MMFFRKRPGVAELGKGVSPSGRRLGLTSRNGQNAELGILSDPYRPPINDTPNPMYSALQTLLLSPDWIPKTYLGLSGTSNSAPPETLTDFPRQRTKDFRAMTFCHFRANLDDTTGRITDFRVLNAFHDGNWTP